MSGSNSWALQILRVEPETAITKYGFIVDTEVYDHTWSGGPCKLECTMGSDSVYRLTAKSGVGDWFFPYCSMSMGGGVGTCMVPFNQPDGTIVTTGGMNGCSLQVNKFKGAFFFYHDLNGNSLKDAPGEVVCRIDYVDYAGTSGTGMQLAKNNTHSNKTTSVFSQKILLHYQEKKAQEQNYCFVVHKDKKWNVVYSSVINSTTITKETSFWTGKETKKTSTDQFKFFPVDNRILASFPDP